MTHATTLQQYGQAIDAELQLAWQDSSKLPPVPPVDGMTLLIDEDFSNGLPPELARYNYAYPPGSHPNSAWWAADRWKFLEPGVLSLTGWREPGAYFPTSPTNYRTAAADGGRLVTAGGGFWIPSARWPEATAQNWPTPPTKTGKARGFLYGRVEFRVRMEPGADVGMVLWLYPADDRRKWPTGTEKDIYENGGGDRQEITATLHWGTSSATRHRELRPYTIDATKWHTVTMDWWPGLLVGYVDGQEVWRIEHEAVASWHMIPGMQTESLTVETSPGPVPAMHIGAIRVWEATSEGIAAHTLQLQSFASTADMKWT